MKHMIKMGIAALVGAAAVATAVPAQPAPPTPEQQAATAVATRQAVFKLLSWNMEPLGGMLRGSVEFDPAVVKTNAANIAGLAPMIPALFTNDTREFDVETRALDSIWTNKADFDSHATELVEAANAVVAAADAGGDAAALRPLIAAMGGGACGGCHDDYRAD